MKKITIKSSSVKRIEDEFNLPLEEVLHELYVVRGLSTDDLVKLLSLEKKKVLMFLRDAGIYSKRLNSLIRIL